MTIRGGGDPSQAWLPRRLREWARRPGTPPSMRMAASWSGLLPTPEYKTVGAIFCTQMAGSPRIISANVTVTIDNRNSACPNPTHRGYGATDRCHP